MTHDELLARVTNQAGWTDNHVNDRITVVVSDWNAGWNARDNTNALRAVVELAGKDIEHESYAWLDGYDYAMKQIIQAIEKELK